jgi:hypothetical protein
LESPPVQGEGVESRLSLCIIAVKPCFLSAQPRRRAVHLCNAGEPLACLEVDDDGAPLDLDPTVAYRFGVLKPN